MLWELICHEFDDSWISLKFTEYQGGSLSLSSLISMQSWYALVDWTGRVSLLTSEVPGQFARSTSIPRFLAWQRQLLSYSWKWWGRWSFSSYFHIFSVWHVMTLSGSGSGVPTEHRCIVTGSPCFLVCVHVDDPRRSKWWGTSYTVLLQSGPISQPRVAWIFLASVWLWHDVMAFSCYFTVTAFPFKSLLTHS